MARRGRLSDEERELLKVQAENIPAELRQKYNIAQLEAALKGQAIDQAREEATGRVALGEKEIGQKDRATALAAASSLLDNESKAQIARDVSRTNQLGDLIAHRPGMDEGVLAETLAREGSPGLYNARATADAKKRDIQISQLVPAMLKAKNDDERMKLGAPFEGVFPGITKDAISKAYPKEGGFTQSKPDLYQGGAVPAATGAASSMGALLGTLLEKGGVVNDVAGGAAVGNGVGGNVIRGAWTGNAAPGSPNNYPVLPITPETRYVPQGAGSLYGSKVVDGGIQTPSGGFIGGNLGDDRLTKLIGLNSDSGSVNTQPTATTPTNAPMFRGAGAGSSWADAGNLVGAPTPTPSFAPLLAGQPQPTATPTITPMTDEMRRRLLATQGY